jgi:hypothetical protein
MPKYILYECGICGAYHPWSWDGDCRDDDHRFAGLEEYAELQHTSLERIEVRSMEERAEADEAGL